jgi:formyl-CoA transferase
VRISVFGQDGPKSGRPGLDRNGVAYGGLLHLTGEEDRPPVRPGVTVTDYLTALFAAQAAMGLLYERDARGTGRGGVIDAYLYGSALRILEWTIAAYDRLGTVRSRRGNRLDYAAPLDNYPSRDGRYVCIVGAAQVNFTRLCRAMDRPDLIEDERFASPTARAAHNQEINAIVAAWVAERDANEVEQRCVECDVIVGTAYDAADLSTDEHVLARDDILDALRRVRLLATDNTPVRLAMGADGLELIAITPDIGQAQETVDATYEGEDLTVAFNPTYLIQGLEVCPDEELRLETCDALKPAVIRGTEDEDFLYLLMPVRVS